MAVKKKLVIPESKKRSSSSSAASRNGLPPGYKEGVKRPYFSTEVDQDTIVKAQLTNNDKIILMSLFLISLGSKIPGLSVPESIIFDEVHTIRNINKYIDGEYFNNVSPPLSFLFYTLIAYLSGYRGGSHELTQAGQGFFGFDFPYVNLRLVTVLIGSFNLPLIFLTLRNSGVRTTIAGLASSLLLFENIIVLHSRLFMPDTLFLFGVSLVVYAYKRLDISKPFSRDWFRFLLLVGVGLGLSVSTKWIGIATIFWVLSLTALKIWDYLGDIEVSDCKVTKHIAYRVFAFLIIPLVIYLTSFYFHLSLLGNFHNDASILSPNFQRSLSFNDIDTVPKYVTYGSTVTIRHADSMGGYLHSHPYDYKSGSRNQQVTVLDFKDFNNEWVIEPVSKVNDDDPRIKPDAEVRLRHKLTGKLLKVTEDAKPPISEQEYDFEVSCFGNSSYDGDQPEKFYLKFQPEEGETYLTSFNTKLQLQNVKKRCYVLSHDLKLPDWGFNQQEVLCISTPTVSRSQFYIETVKYPQYFEVKEGSPFAENQPLENPSFFSKFIELNKKMVILFKNIKVKNQNVSDPLTWPFMFNGLRYTTRENSTLYVIGNPVNFWLTIVLIASFFVIKFVDLLRTDYVKESVQYKSQAFTFVLGWFVHLVPYIISEGEWFLQYYIPSLYFGILVIGVTFEFIYFKNKKLGYFVIGGTFFLAYYYYSTLSPLTFGTKWNQAACENGKLLDTWDFRCDAYKS